MRQDFNVFYIIVNCSKVIIIENIISLEKKTHHSTPKTLQNTKIFKISAKRYNRAGFARDASSIKYLIFSQTSPLAAQH